MKMVFPFEIKYNGEYFSQNKVVSVDEKDVKDLVSIGGKVLEEVANSPPNLPNKTRRGSKK